MRGDRTIKEILRVDRPFDRFGYNFYLWREETIVGESSKIYILDEPPMKEHQKHETVRPFMNISEETVQQLMDELWRLGFKPKEQQYTTEQIKALDSHLQDMRAIVSKKIEVELPK